MDVSTTTEQLHVGSEPPVLPSVGELVRFAVPAYVLWVSGPLLSLVDTAAVGLSAAPAASASQLAALGPATTFCDGATYLFAFLNVATTSLYASAVAANTSALSVVQRASKIAISCGVVLTPLVLFSCRRLLSLYIGESVASNSAILASEICVHCALALAAQAAATASRIDARAMARLICAG